jgi:hypothetical protein
MSWPILDRFDCRSKRYNLRKIYMVGGQLPTCSRNRQHAKIASTTLRTTLLHSQRIFYGRKD